MHNLIQWCKLAISILATESLANRPTPLTAAAAAAVTSSSAAAATGSNKEVKDSLATTAAAEAAEGGTGKGREGCCNLQRTRALATLVQICGS